MSADRVHLIPNTVPNVYAVADDDRCAVAAWDAETFSAWAVGPKGLFEVDTDDGYVIVVDSGVAT